LKKINRSAVGLSTTIIFGMANITIFDAIGRLVWQLLFLLHQNLNLTIFFACDSLLEKLKQFKTNIERRHQ